MKINFKYIIEAFFLFTYEINRTVPTGGRCKDLGNHLGPPLNYSQRFTRPFSFNHRLFSTYRPFKPCETPEPNTNITNIGNIKLEYRYIYPNFEEYLKEIK